MSPEELQSVYTKLVELLDAGREPEARDYLREQLPRLPEDLRNKILFQMFVQGVQDEAREREVIMQIQEEALRAYKTLRELRAEAEQDKS